MSAVPKITIPLDPDLHQEIAQMADHEQRKLANMGRVLLKEAVSARKSPVLSSMGGEVAVGHITQQRAAG